MAQLPKLSVAIIGAGVAGLAAAAGLNGHPDIEYQIYERATRLEEIGASIALGPNGLRTLERLGVDNALDDSIAFRNKSGFPMIYRHWKTNEITSVDSHHCDVEPRHSTARFYRADLQKALLAHVPSSRIHLKKAFASAVYNSATDNLTISFEDGSTVTADILLGADGIRSAVRRYFVPHSEPKWTGWVAFRSVFDVKLLEGLEDAVLNEANHWWGPDRTLFASRLGNGLFTIVGGHYSDPDAPDAPYKDATWNSDGDVNVLRDYYKDWHPVIRRMVNASPYTRQYPNTAAPALDRWTYGHGRITLAGDAAHAHGGALAAGGSLAIDDAYAFVAALWHVFPPGTGSHSSSDVLRALLLYERTRKPHTDRVISTVHEGNKAIIARLRQKSTETEDQLRARIKSRSDPYWIHEHDVVASLTKAIAQELKENSPASKI
ncbi:FAD/NAD(P)-binding domain-containing protein [Rhizodiscina lignyota]|uniref:FAD/NAD(P)-binding domain-containing protein n=1 Tax=Rhizodiscina lignyota TaxID=1504668 RepID=A0A9P4IMV7_9PEZI|nr:FAD/NAD(P)-binding domain-containing protein [Rhizodiscina lignyota]